MTSGKTIRIQKLERNRDRHEKMKRVMEQIQCGLASIGDATCHHCELQFVPGSETKLKVEDTFLYVQANRRKSQSKHGVRVSLSP